MTKPINRKREEEGKQLRGEQEEAYRALTVQLLVGIHDFERSYKYNSKTKGRIRTFYISNDCSTIGDIDFLG